MAKIKKSVKAKGVLALLLVVILSALCTGFAVTQKRAIQKQAETTVPPETQTESESASAPTEAPTESTTVSTTAEPSTAKAPPVSLPAASADNPVIVSPTGDQSLLPPARRVRAEIGGGSRGKLGTAG